MKLPWAQKRIFWVFEKGIFHIFASFWATKLKPFSAKVRQSVQSYLNDNLVIGSFLEKCSKAILIWKTNALSVWKENFSFFYKFLSHEVENIFLGTFTESFQNYLNQNLVIGNFLENCFGAILSSKANLLSVWKNHFSGFCNILSDKVAAIFWGSEAKQSKLFKSQFSYRRLLRKWFWSYLELKNGCSERLKRTFFSFFANLWVTKLKPFFGKVRQCV